MCSSLPGHMAHIRGVAWLNFPVPCSLFSNAQLPATCGEVQGPRARVINLDIFVSLNKFYIGFFCQLFLLVLLLSTLLMFLLLFKFLLLQSSLLLLASPAVAGVSAGSNDPVLLSSLLLMISPWFRTSLLSLHPCYYWLTTLLLASILQQASLLLLEFLLQLFVLAVNDFPAATGITYILKTKHILALE